MPTITSTSSGMIAPTSADVKETIQSIKANFVPGSVITASQINSLMMVWRWWNDHYHQTSDYSFEAYGNTPSAGTYYAQNPDYTAALGGNEPADVAAGEIITAAKHEELRTAYNGANDHTHAWDDYTYYGG